MHRGPAWWTKRTFFVRSTETVPGPRLLSIHCLIYHEIARLREKLRPVSTATA